MIRPSGFVKPHFQGRHGVKVNLRDERMRRPEPKPGRRKCEGDSDDFKNGVDRPHSPLVLSILSGYESTPPIVTSGSVGWQYFHQDRIGRIPVITKSNGDKF